MTGTASAIDLLLVALVACLAAFTTGFAGFGTGLVAAGTWLYLIPSRFVPPLVAMVSIVAQLVSLPHFRRQIDWRSLAPFLTGATLGIPTGVVAQQYASSSQLRLSVGFFLVGYTLFELLARDRLRIRVPGAHAADGVIGAGGGFLGGFAGLSAPLPVIWLRLRGGSPSEQRAVYQPFSLLVLSAASIVMGIEGSIDRSVLILAGWSLPAAIIGAWLGTRCYRLVDRIVFRRIVLSLLLASGLVLIATQ